MAEDIRDLIEKINQEGIRAAEEKAQKIEAEARERAEEILSLARAEAEEMISAAKERIRREDETGRTLLTQAGRDFLVSIRLEINAMLGRIMAYEIGQALRPEELIRIITELIRNADGRDSSDITIILNDNDVKNLELGFLHTLRGEMKKSIVLKPAEEISGGFIISFDGEKSFFDYSDKALAEYIGRYLKPKLNTILQDAGSE